MRIFRHINELISRLDKIDILDSNFIYPYSSNKSEKRIQIWDNMQKGILLEDKQILIPWQTPFNRLNNFKEKRRDSGDRTEWYLGKRTFIDGYVSDIEIMKWFWVPWSNPITRISNKIGFDYEGLENFIFLKEHITNLLGAPTITEIEKFGSFDLGHIIWQNKKVEISLVGIEIFNCRYSLNIGLIHDNNKEYFDNMIKDLKAGGLSEEELGK